MSAGLMTRIVEAVFDLNPDRTGEAVKDALQAGVQPVEIIDYGIARGVEQVGEKYQRQEMFLPELLMAEACMCRGLEAIEASAGEEDEAVVGAARQRLAERAASWIPALSSCVTRLLHSSDSFLNVK